MVETGIILLKNGFIEFFLEPNKISPEEFNIWLNLLCKIEGSYLWLKASNETAKNNLVREACKRGVSSERIIFAEYVEFDQHLKRHSQGDLFFQPTIFLNVKKSMKIFSNENFGPLIPIIKFKEDHEVIVQSNDTNYGLAAYFYTKNSSRIWKMINGLDYGMFGINSGKISTYLNPFGGLKESGIGREGSLQCLDPFLETKFILWNFDE